MRLEADRLGIAGWVRNCSDGSVEALIQGGDATIAAMLAWVRIGPPQARVDRVDQSAAEGEFSGFDTLPSQ